MPREPVRPATDVTLTILPARWRIITRPTACERRNTPVRLVCTIVSHSCLGRSSNGERAADAPAGARHDDDAVAKRVRREAHDTSRGRSVAFAKRARRITTGDWRARSRVVIERREAPRA